MTDFSRLTTYIMDYFPDDSYSDEEIDEWATENVPAWKYMDSQTKGGILEDWRLFVDSIPPDIIDIPPIPPEPEKRSIITKVKDWIRGVFRR